MAEARVYDIKQRTYRYALDVIRFLDELPHDYAVQTMGKQLLRSATSIGANIVEAQAASSRKDFANFYSYALKSSNESKFWLGLLKDSGKASNGIGDALLCEAQELSNILASSILTIKGRRSPF